MGLETLALLHLLWSLLALVSLGLVKMSLRDCAVTQGGSRGTAHSWSKPPLWPVIGLVLTLDPPLPPRTLVQVCDRR